jgi:hypothetical protein
MFVQDRNAKFVILDIFVNKINAFVDIKYLDIFCQV